MKRIKLKSTTILRCGTKSHAFPAGTWVDYRVAENEDGTRHHCVYATYRGVTYSGSKPFATNPPAKAEDDTKIGSRRDGPNGGVMTAGGFYTGD